MSGAATVGSRSAASMRLMAQRFRNPYWAALQQKRTRSKVFHRDLARARGATDWRGQPIFTPQTWNITKGDLVEVTQASLVKDWATGQPKQNKDGQTMTQKWHGQQGIVLAVLRKQERVIVQGVNIKTRVGRPTDHSRGPVYEAESPIPYQHVTLVDPSTGRPAVGGIKRVPRTNGVGKDRLIVSTNTIVPVPDRGIVKKTKRTENPRTDTSLIDATAVTYVQPEYTSPRPQLDAEGKPILVREERPLNFEEILAIKKKAARQPNGLTDAQRERIAHGKKTFWSTVLEPESLELRAARTKF